MASNQTVAMDITDNDNENDSIIPTGECKWTASTGFRPPSDCFAPYIIRIARRASFPPSESPKQYGINAFNHRRPAARNLLKEIFEASKNITDNEEKKMDDDSINPPKRTKLNDSFNDLNLNSSNQSNEITK